MVPAALLCWLVCFAPDPGGATEPAPLSAFFGRFEGKSTVADDGVPTSRDLGVSIEPAKSGFRVSWRTTVHDDGEESTKEYAIEFRPTARSGVYASEMRVNMFGQRVPLDPLKGDPFVWARLQDRTLTVFALIVTEHGGYDLQTYERTLLPDGNLGLRFWRHRHGKPVREVSGVLTRVAP